MGRSIQGLYYIEVCPFVKGKGEITYFEGGRVESDFVLLYYGSAFRNTCAPEARRVKENASNTSYFWCLSN